MNRLNRFIPAVALVLAAVPAGCQSVYRSETVLHDDGSVERSIYQEAKETPAEVQNPRLWTQTTFAPKPDALEKQGFAGPIAYLPIQGSDPERPYFAAWGRFKTVKDLPEHVVFKAPEGSGLPDSKLARASVRTDYVFAVEHRWRETLTDVVTLPGMRRAREELADLLINVLSDAFDEALGNEYDAAALFQLLRGESKTWFAELTDFLFIHCATHKTDGVDLALLDGLAEICARHGLVLKKDGKFLEKEALDKAVDDFVLDQLCAKVRSKASGKAVDRKTAAAWIKSKKQGETSLLSQAWDKVITTKYGGEAFDRRLGTLLARVLGLHVGDAMSQNRQFEYTLTVPGEVVETNGRILAGDRVRWKFRAWDAYPLGYDMTCRSLDARPQAQKKLLHGEPLKSRESLVRFADLADGLPGVADALQECRKRGKLAPLYAYRLKVARNPKTPVKPVDDLLKLLGLPEQPPKE
jgi:hypothetical protein